MTSLVEIAKAKGQDYVGPEDVQEAIDAGVSKLDLWEELLGILGGQIDLGLEDKSLCCFVAQEFLPMRSLPADGSMAPGVYLCRTTRGWTVARMNEAGAVVDILAGSDGQRHPSEIIEAVGGKVL